jgi:hypothetical protein
MQLMEEACVAECEGDYRRALAKAKEASNKERVLIKMQEQSDLGDLHDIDLTFVVNVQTGFKNIVLLINIVGFIHSWKPVRRQRVVHRGAEYIPDDHKESNVFKCSSTEDQYGKHIFQAGSIPNGGENVSHGSGSSVVKSKELEVLLFKKK